MVSDQVPWSSEQGKKQLSAKKARQTETRRWRQNFDIADTRHRVIEVYRPKRCTNVSDECDRTK